MARITRLEKGIETVDDLIVSLQRFPSDMPIRCHLDYAAVVFHAVPQKGESFVDKRGYISIEGDDGSWEN